MMSVMTYKEATLRANEVRVSLIGVGRSATVLKRQSNTPLVNLLTPGDYLCYAKTKRNETTEVFGSKEMFTLMREDYGKNPKMWDLTGDGNHNVWDMLKMSSNFGKENNEITWSNIIIYQQYSSHYEFNHTGNIIINGQEHVVYFGFMEKSQADEQSGNDNFRTVGLKLITNLGEYDFLYGNKNYLLSEK